MPILILGLLIFLGLHSLRIFASGWRDRQVARLGLKRWKLLYALVAVVGLVLICWGFSLAKLQPVRLYAPPPLLRHLNALFTLVAFVLFFAAKVPRNHLKARLGHPQVLAVKVWAFGHLLATGMLRDVLLFGSFLLWAIVLYIVSRRRDRLAGTVYPAGTLKADLIMLALGIGVWLLFAFWLHLWLFGVNPLV